MSGDVAWKPEARERSNGTWLTVRLWLVAILFGGLLGFLSGCSSESYEGSVSPPQGLAPLSEWMAYFDVVGTNDAMAPEQREVLEAAAEVGELTYSDVSGLIELAFDCMEDQGLRPSWLEPGDHYGFRVPRYVVAGATGVSLELNEAAIDRCVDRYSASAEQLYLWQPKISSVEMQNWDLHHRPPTLECLREHGVQIDDDATRAEIAEAAGRLMGPHGGPDNWVVGPICYSTE